MLAPLLIAFGLPWFLVLSLYVCAMVRFLSDADEPDYQSRPLYIATGLLLVVLLLFGNVPPKRELLAGFLPWLSSMATTLGVYLFVCGPAWAAFRWQFVFLNRCRTKYEAVRDAWLFRNKLPAGEVPAESRAAFRAFLLDYHFGDSYTDWVYPYRGRGVDSTGLHVVQIWPSWRDHKARVFSWWLWWPMSLASYLLWDFVRNVFSHVFQAMARAMDSLSRRRFADVERDVEAQK